MIYGYARCSTNEDKQDISRQVRDLKAMGATIIFEEYASGTKDDRKKLNELLQIVQSGDTIICTEVSRLSRSTKHFCYLIELVKEKKIKLIAGTLIFDCTSEQIDPTQQMMMQLVSVFSEFERNMISERTKSALAAKKALGVKLGRPEITKDNIPSKYYKYYMKYKKGENTITEISKILNVSRTTLYKYFNLIES